MPFYPARLEKGTCVDVPDFTGRHRALGQALLDNRGGVLPFHARRGILGKSLPVTMIAGIKKVKDKPTLLWRQKAVQNTTEQGAVGCGKQRRY
jgi:hypothetical protein